MGESTGPTKTCGRLSVKHRGSVWFFLLFQFTAHASLSLYPFFIMLLVFALLCVCSAIVF